MRGYSCNNDISPYSINNIILLHNGSLQGDKNWVKQHSVLRQFNKAYTLNCVKLNTNTQKLRF